METNSSSVIFLMEHKVDSGDVTFCRVITFCLAVASVCAGGRSGGVVFVVRSFFL